MSSKHIRGDVDYTWPTAEIAVMRRAQNILSFGVERPGKDRMRIDEYKKRFANRRSAEPDVATSTR